MVKAPSITGAYRGATDIRTSMLNPAMCWHFQKSFLNTSNLYFKLNKLSELNKSVSFWNLNPDLGASPRPMPRGGEVLTVACPLPIEKHLPMFLAQRERTVHVISKAWRLCVYDGVGSRACDNSVEDKVNLIAEGNESKGMFLLVGATQVSEVSKFRKAFNFSSKSEEGAVLSISDMRRAGFCSQIRALILYSGESKGTGQGMARQTCLTACVLDACPFLLLSRGLSETRAALWRHLECQQTDRHDHRGQNTWTHKATEGAGQALRKADPLDRQSVSERGKFVSSQGAHYNRSQGHAGTSFTRTRDPQTWCTRIFEHKHARTRTNEQPAGWNLTFLSSITLLFLLNWRCRCAGMPGVRKYLLRSLLNRERLNSMFTFTALTCIFTRAEVRGGLY